MTKEVREYMTSKMGIDLKVYDDRITKYSLEHIELFKELGNYLLTKELDDTCESDFQDSSWEFVRKYGNLSEETEETIHILIRAFKIYRFNGLLELYHYTETDDWEPLPIVSESIYSEMTDCDKKTFDAFPTHITIYRGTSEKESNGSISNFGQSWTTDINKAEYFAFELEQAKDSGTMRVVLEAKISKEHIYAYCSRSEEKLCIVNPQGIINDSIKVVRKKQLQT